MFPRATVACGLGLLAVWLLADRSGGERRATEADGVRTVNGVRMEEIPLAEFTPAVPPRELEQGTCETSNRPGAPVARVRMRFPGGDPPGINHVVLTLNSAGTPRGYSEMRRTPAGETTSILIHMDAGTGGATNITEKGARVTVGTGTADEALRSEALGVPARRMAAILERCGGP